jgi:hypothetical protein
MWMRSCWLGQITMDTMDNRMLSKGYSLSIVAVISIPLWTPRTFTAQNT